mgnify:CR=1 FL=1
MMDGVKTKEEENYEKEKEKKKRRVDGEDCGRWDNGDIGNKENMGEKWRRKVEGKRKSFVTLGYYPDFAACVDSAFMES